MSFLTALAMARGDATNAATLCHDWLSSGTSVVPLNWWREAHQICVWVNGVSAVYHFSNLHCSAHTLPGNSQFVPVETLHSVLMWSWICTGWLTRYSCTSSHQSISLLPFYFFHFILFYFSFLICFPTLHTTISLYTSTQFNTVITLYPYTPSTSQESIIHTQASSSAYKLHKNRTKITNLTHHRFHMFTRITRFTITHMQRNTRIKENILFSAGISLGLEVAPQDGRAASGEAMPQSGLATAPPVEPAACREISRSRPRPRQGERASRPGHR
jgi:hypothetical protein